MLTAQGDDRVVMTEDRKERRDGDVRFALVLDESAHCAQSPQIICDCFRISPFDIVVQYVLDVVT